MARAFVIGNIALDSFFRVDALPERGASILGGRGMPDLGGKGANKAVILARAGIATTLVAAVGADPEAARLRRLLADEPLHAELTELPDRPTDVSVILTEPDGANAIVTSNACARALPPSAYRAVLGAAEPGDVVLLQGNTAVETTSEILSLSAARGLRTVLNPSPFAAGHAALLARAQTVVLNEGEARSVTGRHGAEAARALRGLGVETVVLTLGAAGALCDCGQGLIHVPACPVEVVDATGAGDSFEAVAVASSLLRGAWMDRAALGHAAAAAAISVSRAGALASFARPEELAALLR